MDEEGNSTPACRIVARARDTAVATAEAPERTMKAEASEGCRGLTAEHASHTPSATAPGVPPLGG